MSNDSDERAARDRVLLATVEFNGLGPGLCIACKQRAARRSRRTGYVNDVSEEERARVARGEANEAEVVDRHYQQVATRQRAGRLADLISQDVLCGRCAARLIDSHLSRCE